ncbi:hypothetical protein [Azohydromonas caseinilytica]|uniref:3-deoxy-D-arabino-heptulosonate 7-phosphate synthase n=1 Tax=Azohydromonas caseinilytica TaxID=2728836 RepID=A0A848FL98_9BURK|nr:hypothetical protein [Azohydromonas caseinilytica]NML19003.1 hypothetical protein [Azohydromonas caseinilytica]
MPPHAALLLAALRLAPRRYRLPPLPADIDAARAGGSATGLAFAMEAARGAFEHGTTAPQDVKALFIQALAGLIREALQAPEQGGDPTFQALVLKAREAQVDEHVRLGASSKADQRAVRAAVNAVAHPGKLQGLAPGAVSNALAELHRLLSAGAWRELKQAIGLLLAQTPQTDEPWHPTLEAVHASPALERLERGAALLDVPSVQRYLALCEQRGPLAGSNAAATQGRASARVGAVAEATTMQAFRAIAELLNRLSPGHRAVRSLRTPAGFPGEAGNAKDEWDAAIVRAGDGDAAVDIALLAEVKAAPSAATPDFAGLLRGLRRLAQAHADAVYAFPSPDGAVSIRGASLQQLRPHAHALPAQVIYCCAAPPEPQPALLSAAGKAMLLAEPGSVDFGQRLARGETPAREALAPVWDALTTAPRLHAALHQYDTARRVREVMLHPEDLLAAVAAVLADGG